MKQLAWTLPLIVVVGIGCEPRTEPIDTVRNDVIARIDTDGDDATENYTVTISAVQVRLRAEGDDENGIEFAPSGDFGANILPSAASPAVDSGMACETQSDCPADGGGVVNRCTTGVRADGEVGTTCWAFTEIGSNEVDCGIYDVRFTDDEGNTCDIIINDGATDSAGQACERTADCDGPFRCIDGSCQFSYAGDGAYLCYVAERWDLSNHISDGSCPDFFPEPFEE